MTKGHLRIIFEDLDASILSLQDAKADAKRGACNSSTRNIWNAQRRSRYALLTLNLIKTENQEKVYQA